MHDFYLVTCDDSLEPPTAPIDYEAIKQHKGAVPHGEGSFLSMSGSGTMTARGLPSLYSDNQAPTKRLLPILYDVYAVSKSLPFSMLLTHK